MSRIQQSPTTQQSPMVHPVSPRGGALGIALFSALAFGASGPFAKSLLEAGWSPGAAVLVRVGGAALVLLVPAILAWRRQRLSATDNRLVVAYGIIAIAGAQVCFFSAVQTLDVGVALLLEYLAPVLLVGLAWVRSGRAPSLQTIIGTMAAMLGLILVLDLSGGASVDLGGVAWGLAAAFCLAGYFLMSAKVSDSVPAVVLAGGGLTVGAIAVALLGVIGLLPLHATSAPVQVMGATTSWLLPAAVLIGVSTVIGYLTGIVAAGQLGSKVASFLGLTEVLFAVLIAWLMLGELPSIVQLLGGLSILAGVVLVQLGDRATVSCHDDADSQHVRPVAPALLASGRL